MIEGKYKIFVYPYEVTDYIYIDFENYQYR